MFREAVACQKCNDHGYVTVVYPKGYETIRVCDCAAAHERFGENTFKEVDNRPSNLYWSDMRMFFGGETKADTQRIMNEYKLETFSPRHYKGEIVKKWIKKG